MVQWKCIKMKISSNFFFTFEILILYVAQKIAPYPLMAVIKLFNDTMDCFGIESLFN